ncbi:MAG: WecB/TagA/CpsF family glycosyltransferase [Treponema sp.]|nr:WecB/TagA/CpsF family glycosyltransferase [Treponema sp.]
MNELTGNNYFSINNYSINKMPCAVPSSFSDIQQYFLNVLEGNEKHLISFVNPEIFLQAEKNPFMMWYLQQTEFNFVDGNGLLLAINKLCGTSYKADSRYPGTDFFSYLPTNREVRVFLYGASEENNLKASEKIHTDYPNVVICGRLNGYEQKSDDEIISIVNESNPEILIVCLGAPRQECWILKNKEKLNVKILFGNGGSIDFWSGSVKRAPDFMIQHRLEWLYRLGQDFTFKRIKRQLGLFPFALRILFKKFEVVQEI